MSSRGRRGGILLPSGATDIPVGALYTHRHRELHRTHHTLRLQGSDCFKCLGRRAKLIAIAFLIKQGHILAVCYKII